MAITGVQSNYFSEIEKGKEVVSNEKKKETNASRTVKEYSEYLNNKYEGLQESEGNSVTIAPSLLAKAATDEKTSNWLEHNLKLIPDIMDKIYESTAKAGGRVISCDISFDGYDSMTTQVHTVFEAEPGTDETKKLVEEARAKNKERREQQEKIIEKNKEKEQAEEEGKEIHSQKIVTDSAESLLNKIEHIEYYKDNKMSIDIRG